MRIRRAMHKQSGGAVSVPVSRSNKQIKDSIRKKIEDGTYNTGTPVVQTVITKFKVNNDGNVEKRVVDVHARKIPLIDIRKEAANKNKELLRLRDDNYYRQLTKEEVKVELEKLNEETTEDIEEMKNRLKLYQRQRHWLLWHDHSTIANHGHMLFAVRELYDPAIHLTPEEVLHKTNTDVDVQATVEEPYFYMIGQSSSTVEDQMRFVQTRQDDLKNLSQDLATNGVRISDVMRFMNGDFPAVQMEDGNQHGGNYPCPGCDIDINSSFDLEYALQRQYKSLTEKKDLILAGILGKEGGLHPFRNLKVNELRDELKSRGISNDGEKKVLQANLAEALGGTTRLPPLLADHDAKQLNLESYEVLFFEALHCCMNHIKNILDELPYHITDIDTLIKVKEVLSVQLSKEKLRGVDYRKTLIILTIAVYPLANIKVKSLLVSLCEMIEIAYTQDHHRSPKMILRFYNLCFKHAILCRIVLTPPKKLTYRKLFGSYFHSFVAHAPFLLRHISHRSTNAEMFERLFEKLSDITSKTWSKRIEDLAKNVVLHIQVESANKKSRTIVREEREISHIAKSLPKMGNTLLTKDYVERYSGDWQEHLKNVSDFLLPGKGVWWDEIDGCIEFFDGPDQPAFREEGPRLHHFRSSSIVKEQKYLNECWEKSLKSKVEIPATKLKDNNGKWQRHPTCCQLDAQIPLEKESTDIESEQMQDKDSNNLSYPNDFDDDCAVNDNGDDNYILDEPNVLNFTEKECQVEKQVIVQPMDTSDNYNTIQQNQTPDYLPAHDENQQSIAGTKRRAAQRESPETMVPEYKKNKIDTTELQSKTSKALEQVLGTCEAVHTYDKLRQNVKEHPKSKYHIDRYEAHLANIQISILKAYKQISDDIKNLEKRASTNQDSDIAMKIKQKNIASALFNSWKMTVHIV